MALDLTIRVSADEPLRTEFIGREREDRIAKMEVSDNSTILYRLPEIRELGAPIPGPEVFEFILRVVGDHPGEAALIGAWLYKKLIHRRNVVLQIGGSSIAIDERIISEAVERHLRTSPRKIAQPKTVIREREIEEVERDSIHR